MVILSAKLIKLAVLSFLNETIEMKKYQKIENHDLCVIRFKLIR